jgi:hypothetical protein
VQPKPWYTKITRDVVLFVSGLLGVLHETLIWDGNERVSLLFLFGGMMGLPVFLRKDEGGK